MNNIGSEISPTCLTKACRRNVQKRESDNMFRKKGFITSGELIVLSIITGILGIIILSSTVSTMQKSVDQNIGPKIEQDLWRN